MVRLEKMILREIKALRQASTITSWTQHVRCYNKLQERYAKEHGGNIYQPVQPTHNEWELRHYHD
jgi:hypothetical protein